MVKLVSLNIALPETVNLGGGNKKCRTGIFKKPITEKIFLSESGFDGDGVGIHEFMAGGIWQFAPILLATFLFGKMSLIGK